MQPLYPLHYEEPTVMVVPQPAFVYVHPHCNQIISPAQYYPQYNSHQQLPSTYKNSPRHIAPLPRLDSWPQQQKTTKRMVFSPKRQSSPKRTTCLSILKQRTQEELEQDLLLQRSIQKLQKRTPRGRLNGFQL